MKLEKAISKLQYLQVTHWVKDNKDEIEALQLGIEAMKRIQDQHEDDELLPGETEGIGDMMTEELREKIAEVFYGRPIPKLVDWLQFDSFAEWDKHVKKSFDKADQILSLIKEAGYVRLADQSLPPMPKFYDDWGGESAKAGYLQAQADMLKQGWCKVELEEKK